MNWLKQIGLALWGIVCFIGGLFVYAKMLDKPDTVINNEYDKIKNKGTNNSVDVQNESSIQQKEDNRKFKLFRRKNKAGN